MSSNTESHGTDARIDALFAATRPLERKKREQARDRLRGVAVTAALANLPAKAAASIAAGAVVTGATSATGTGVATTTVATTAAATGVSKIAMVLATLTVAAGTATVAHRVATRPPQESTHTTAQESAPPAIEGPTVPVPLAPDDVPALPLPTPNILQEPARDNSRLATRRNNPEAAPAIPPPEPSEPEVVAPQEPVEITNSFSDEVRLIARARAAESQGQIAAGLAALEEHSQRFASGSLREEREALQLMLQCRAGVDVSVALATFRSRYPASTYRGRIAARCETPVANP